MKKIVLIVTMLYAMSFCEGVVYADNTAAYAGDDNTAIIGDTSDYSTVLITKASDGSIVYVKQADDMFDELMHFMLKENPSVGLYNVKLGSMDGTTGSATFYIGVNSNNDSDTPMTRLSRTETFGGYYTAGFETTIDCDAFLSYKSVKVGYNNGVNDIYGGFAIDEHWNPPVVSGEGNIRLLFVLDHIEYDELPTVSVFLSTDNLKSGAVKGSAYR